MGVSGPDFVNNKIQPKSAISTGTTSDPVNTSPVLVSLSQSQLSATAPTLQTAITDTNASTNSPSLVSTSALTTSKNSISTCLPEVKKQQWVSKKTTTIANFNNNNFTNYTLYHKNKKLTKHYDQYLEILKINAELGLKSCDKSLLSETATSDIGLSSSWFSFLFTNGVLIDEDLLKKLELTLN